MGGLSSHPPPFLLLLSPCSSYSSSRLSCSSLVGPVQTVLLCPPLARCVLSVQCLAELSPCCTCAHDGHKYVTFCRASHRACGVRQCEWRLRRFHKITTQGKRKFSESQVENNKSEQQGAWVILFEEKE